MKKVVLIAIILGLLVAGGGVAGYFYFTSPVDASNTVTRKITIESGSTAKQVADQLYTVGLIKHPLAFRGILKLQNASNKLQAGQFELSPSQSLEEIIVSLQKPADDITITILPGWRLEEIADYLASQEFTVFNRDEFVQLTGDLEGRLAANTFRVHPYVSTQELVTLLTKQFETDIIDPFSSLQMVSGHDWNRVLTMASILQREARGLEEMQVIAGLLEKRLEEGMPLQLCATLQYCRGQAADGKFWNPPLAADKNLQCAYNTYQNPGLPPGPISTVSPNAVEAALTPVESDYYYYIHGDDGQVHYATTLDEHDANIDAYLK